MLFLRFPGTAFLSMPILISLASFFLYFNVSDLDMKVPFTLGFIALSIGLFEVVFYLVKNKNEPSSLLGSLELKVEGGRTLKIVLGFLTAAIFIFGLLDLSIHGVVLFGDRSKYYLFNEYEARIRHISSLVWIFAPLSLSNIFSKKVNVGLLVWAFLFPVLVLDRNRFLMSAFSLTAVFFILNRGGLDFRKKCSVAVIFVLLSVFLFSVFGSVRSGPTGIVQAYSDSRETQMKAMGTKENSTCDLPSFIPANEALKKLDTRLQWFVIYTASPIYNLSIQEKCGISDASVLKAQIIPLWKRFNAVGGPVLVSPRLTAGTEAMPFFLAFGVGGIIFCALLELLVLKLTAQWFSRSRSIFGMLIFLRFSYCALFFSFDPQFFLWTSFALCLVMLGAERTVQMGVKIAAAMRSF